MTILQMGQWAIAISLVTPLSGWACSDLLKAYPLECLMADRYAAVTEQFKSKYGLNVEYLSGYRSLRLIEANEYDRKRKEVQNMPWKIYEPSPKTWIYWEKGALLAEQMAMDEKKISFTKDDIQNLNKALITPDMMTFLSRIKFNSPGKIRSSSLQPPPGTSFSCGSNPLSDKGYENLKNYEAKTKEGVPLVRMRFFSKCNGPGWGGQLWFVPSDEVPEEMDRWLEFFNKNFTAYLKGTPTEMSPLEFAAMSQRWFLGIHPFGDGNGRTSRFIQDIVLEKLGLPYMPTGRIELSVSRADYVKKSIEELEKSLGYLEKCLKEYESRARDKKYRVRDQCVSIYQDIDTGESVNIKRERVAFYNDLLKDNLKVASGIDSKIKSVMPPVGDSEKKENVESGAIRGD